MREFDAQLLRLKECLGVVEDQEVATLLGMSKFAFSDRKKRGSFPTDKLLALKASRPELNLDTTYILTGVADTVHRKIASDLDKANDEIAALFKVGEKLGVYTPNLERQLLELFRQSTDAGKEAIMATAKAVEKNKGEKHEKS
jgi:hypothetical protein